MNKTVSVYKSRVNLGDLRDLLTEAEAIGATDDTWVDVKVAPRYDSPVDPGGEISLSVTTSSS